MSVLTIGEFNVSQNSIYAIGAEVGAPGEPVNGGTLEQMSQAFGHDLSAEPTVANMSALIGKVGAAAELQNNLPVVQERLGTGQSGIELAVGWVDKSGLLTPVVRSYMRGSEVSIPTLTEDDADARAEINDAIDEQLDALRLTEEDGVIATDGVLGWIRRKAGLTERVRQAGAGVVVVAANERPMNPNEADGLPLEEDEVIQPGMTSADYVKRNIVPRLTSEDNFARVPDGLDGKPASGNAVAQAAAQLVARQIDLSSARIVVPATAGLWPQVGGQIRRALRGIQSDFDADGQQLVVVSDPYPVDRVGGQHKSRFQNSQTALGLIPRAGQEFLHHQ
ncbi:MAG TPA: hypothetical protein VGS08_05740 [Candidatus Saccharimonadales bacterium]|nr:hypothetical protein [Candidatus Saccharimonadales bacterium]